jgi:hypothetical protein
MTTNCGEQLVQTTTKSATNPTRTYVRMQGKTADANSSDSNCGEAKVFVDPEFYPEQFKFPVDPALVAPSLHPPFPQHMQPRYFVGRNPMLPVKAEPKRNLIVDRGAETSLTKIDKQQPRHHQDDENEEKQGEEYEQKDNQNHRQHPHQHQNQKQYHPHQRQYQYQQNQKHQQHKQHQQHQQSQQQQQQQQDQKKGAHVSQVQQNYRSSVN